MSDASLRERRKAKAVEDAKKGKSKTGRTRQPWFLYLAGLVGFSLVVYQFPDFFKVLVEPWIEIGDATLHGVTVGQVSNFSVDVERRDAVVEAFKHAWLAYERDALGDDEYHPISKRGSNLSAHGGIGYTVIDSLDTMMIMGLDDEVKRAREWVATKLSFDVEGNFNTFETTIRVLGGLLSAYHLSGNDPLYLEKAVDLADRMVPVFSTPSGLPLSSVNLLKKEGIPSDNNGLVSTAEVATLQLEFRYLSFLTDEEAYWNVVERVMHIIKANQATPRLAAIFMNPTDGRFVTSEIRLGSRGDSFYEYLLKQFLQTSRKEDVYAQMYTESMDAIHGHLVSHSMSSGLTYTSELLPERHPEGEMAWRLSPKQDHLVCFLGGSLMLGATTVGSLVDKVSVPPRPNELTAYALRDWRTGVELIKTCMETHKTATGLSPEIVHFRIPSDNLGAGFAPNDWYIKGSHRGLPPPLDARYILRPETVESLFIAFRLTGDKRYRDHGWEIFQAIQKHCRIESGGYASVINVDELPVRHEDKMETFMMSETLKYLYLLFSDDKLLPLSKYVFNTEAHPLPIFTTTRKTRFS